LVLEVIYNSNSHASISNNKHTTKNIVDTPELCSGVVHFIAVLDGFSRMVLAWDVFMTIETWTVQMVVQKAKEQHPFAKPRCITDNGSRFISRNR
jgi:hypothetical protein